MSKRIAKLTKRVVDAAAPNAERYVIWDSALKGFGLRVEPSGTKTFLVRYRAAGRKRFVAVGRFGPLTPEQARGLAQATLSEVHMGHDPAEERRRERAAITVAELARRFLAEHVGPKRKGTTAIHYRSLIERYLVPKHGVRKVHDLSRPDLARLHLSMREQPYQANRLLAVVASMYSFGERMGLTPEAYNPASRIERFPESRRERFLSKEELGRLGEAFRRFEGDGRFREGVAALRLLLFTGARLREILHLRWEHVDLDRGLLFLPDSKTGKKTITLNAPAMMVLSSLERVGDCVIPGANPNVPRADLKKPWLAVTEAAGLEGLRIHDLRHSFASVGAGAGLGLPIVGKLLGHMQTATTQRYAHLDADPVRLAADKIGASLAAALDGSA
ncbi:site-specific integrase [Methylocystis sp. JR02]|uniref:site-specific integrase n=1 Tax=Methylocystis sp. JR02 TaxID=3046284 RepID=UPI0024BA83E6|nr:site-specific integrase [Methylocystis sp. JR02]MDJ0450406.1 site-specific integrase [Methylocystis sp. JR02]